MALTVYKQIAKDALMSWNGLSEEEATKVVQESSNEELESQVYAQGSIDAAIKGFQKYSQEYLKNKNGYEQPISEQDMETFKEIIMTGDYRNGSTNDFFETVKKQMGLGRENTDEKQIAEDTRDMASPEDLWLTVLNIIVMQVPTALAPIRARFSKENICQVTWDMFR